MNNDEAQIRRAFEYARDSSMPTIVCSPDPGALISWRKWRASSISALQFIITGPVTPLPVATRRA
jgi:hypothetical protein